MNRTRTACKLARSLLKPTVHPFPFRLSRKQIVYNFKQYFKQVRTLNNIKECKLQLQIYFKICANNFQTGSRL